MSIPSEGLMKKRLFLVRSLSEENEGSEKLRQRDPVEETDNECMNNLAEGSQSLKLLEAVVVREKEKTRPIIKR